MNIKIPTQSTKLDQNTDFETQAVRLFRALEFEILSGKLEPGQRLLRRDLCRRFGLSQATVSEALWRLESDGMAESAPMYGTRVVPITIEKVNDELVLREALECQIARMAATAIRPSHIPRLQELADQVDELISAGTDYCMENMQIHQEFHLEIGRLAGSPLLLRDLERSWRRHFMFFSWISAKVWPSPPQWHRRLLDALLTGKPDVAEKVMRKHVLFGRNHQVEVLEKIQSEGKTTLSSL